MTDHPGPGLFFWDQHVQVVPGAGGLAVVGEHARGFVDEVKRLIEFERRARTREFVLVDELPPAKYFALRAEM